MKGTIYTLEESNNLGTQSGWDHFVLIFFVQHDGISGGKPFAKMEIHLRSWNNRPDPKPLHNLQISLQWMTIRDKNGQLLPQEQPTWAYSDVIQVPFKVDASNYVKLGEELADKFLPGRLNYRKSLENNTKTIFAKMKKVSEE